MGKEGIGLYFSLGWAPQQKHSSLQPGRQLCPCECWEISCEEFQNIYSNLYVYHEDYEIITQSCVKYNLDCGTNYARFKAHTNNPIFINIYLEVSPTEFNRVYFMERIFQLQPTGAIHTPFIQLYLHLSQFIMQTPPISSSKTVPLNSKYPVWMKWLVNCSLNTYENKMTSVQLSCFKWFANLTAGSFLELPPE